MSIWRNLENATATIYEEVVVDQVDDGMGGTTAVTDWRTVHTAIGVGFEPNTTFTWATVDGEDHAHEGALFVPKQACDAVEAGVRVDVTHRGTTTQYRVENARVLDSPTGAHAEAVLVTVGDDDGAT